MNAHTVAIAADSVAVKIPAITPTTTIRMVIRAQMESFSETSTFFTWKASPLGYLRFLETKNEKIINARASNRPGTKPPRKSFPMERPPAAMA
ncbi:hypothetical protein SDC9_117024 [bioreactor metagenome]|uniref:Uncharacterized protein n=1 Tax=bioreactor metagenome TaxID=1076179 RepID=A0A645C3Z6_9ZZZZ